MLVTTTHNVEGKRILEYKGLVAGEAILGANLFRDLFASIRDIVGGRAGSYEKVLNDARQTAVGEMTDKAEQLGANAVNILQSDHDALLRRNVHTSDTSHEASPDRPPARRHSIYVR